MCGRVMYVPFASKATGKTATCNNTDKEDGVCWEDNQIRKHSYGVCRFGMTYVSFFN